MEFKRNGLIMRKVFLAADKRQFTVFDQEARYDPLTHKQIDWINNYVIDCPNRDYAKTSFIGRSVVASYEEGNIEVRQIAEHYAKSVR